MAKELRRQRITLATLGSGVIAFGVWSIMKTFLYMWVNPATLDVSALEPQLQPVVRIIVYIFTGLILAIDLSLRLYVGRSAQAVGMGEKKGSAYIVTAAIMMAFSAVSLFLYLFFRAEIRTSGQSELDFYVSILVELSSSGIFAGLIYSSVRVRQLQKALEG